MSALAFAVALAACVAAGLIGSAFTRPAIPSWYASLRKPDWTPPSWLFAPVWSALYATMAVAVWIVWERVGFAGAPYAFMAFAIQLVLNAGWSALFFGVRNLRAAFVEIVCLWAVVACTTYLFAMVEPLAGALLLPYLAWLSFAAALNFSIARLN